MRHHENITAWFSTSAHRASFSGDVISREAAEAPVVEKDGEEEAYSDASRREQAAGRCAVLQAADC